MIGNIFHYLYNSDGMRVESIFDITKITKVLIAGKEKYNLIPLKANDFINGKNTEKETKEVCSIVKHACVSWLDQNSIFLDHQFRDTRLGNKVVRVKKKGILIILILKLGNLRIEGNLDETSMSFQESMSDDDILVKIIEKTISEQAQSKYEKEFYHSLKPKESNQGFDSY